MFSTAEIKRDRFASLAAINPAARGDMSVEDIVNVFDFAEVPEKVRLERAVGVATLHWTEGDEAELAELFSEQNWVREPGPRSQDRWKNTKTGIVKYSKDNPGGKGRGGKPQAAASAGKSKRQTTDSNIPTLEKAPNDARPTPMPASAKAAEKTPASPSKTPAKDVGKSYASYADAATDGPGVRSPLTRTLAAVEKLNLLHNTAGTNPDVFADVDAIKAEIASRPARELKQIAEMFGVQSFGGNKKQDIVDAIGRKITYAKEFHDRSQIKLEPAPAPTSAKVSLPEPPDDDLVELFSDEPEPDKVVEAMMADVQNAKERAKSIGDMWDQWEEKRKADQQSRSDAIKAGVEKADRVIQPVREKNQFPYNDAYFDAVEDAAGFEFDRLVNKYGIAGAVPIATAALVGAGIGGATIGLAIGSTTIALSMAGVNPGIMDVVKVVSSLGAGLVAAPVIGLVHTARGMLRMLPGTGGGKVETHAEDTPTKMTPEEIARAAVEFIDRMKIQCYGAVKCCREDDDEDDNESDVQETPAELFHQD